jgi:hypothetical protein
MTTFRRTLVLLALMFWLGGFMFYGAVVVPIVRAKLEGMPERSTITQRVTGWINLSGTLAVLVMFVDAYASTVRRNRARWIAWVCMTLPLPVLVWLHSRLSQQMADPLFYTKSLATFQPWHQAYLILNSLQWLAAVIFTVLTVRAWRLEDRTSSQDLAK